MSISKYERVEQITEHPVPSEMRQDTIYLEGEPGHTPDFAFFLCPCECQTLIALPLYSGQKRESPSWQIQATNPVTLAPSIRQIRGCKAHFFIRNNAVDWCEPIPQR